MPGNDRVDFDLAVQVAELRATNQRIESLSQKTDERFRKIEESLASAKVWALGLYIALAGSLFYVLAHGFRWL